MILSLINVWLCIFSLAGYSFSFKKYFNQRFGFSLLLTLSGICCLSYLFSITFENIYLPMRFFYFFGLVLFFFFVFFSVIQKWQDHSDTHKILLCETILSPYFLSFFAITNFIYWIYYPSAIFHEFDEFAHWGVTIKEIYVKGRLFRLQDIADNFNSDGGFAYTPMTSISHYFFLKNISPTIFSESIVLFANSLLLTLPIYYCMNFSEKKIGGLKKWLTAFLGSIALVILYTTLIVGRKFTIIYVDSCLGLFFGIVCSHNLLYAKSNKINAVFFNIFLFFSTFFLVLVKDFGLFLAAMTTPLVWINNLGNNKDKCRWMVLRSNVISSVVSIFAILLARLSWQGVVTDKALSYPNLSLQKSVDFFSLTDVQIQIIKNFISNWGHCFTFTEYRVLELFIAICLAAIFIKNLIPKNVRNTILLTLLYVVGSYVMYSLCLLYLYLTRFVEFEALQSASYERYLGTAAYGYLIVLFALISSKIVPAISRDKIKIFTSYILDKKNRSLKVSISLISLTFFLIVIVKIGEEVERGKDAIKREVIKNLELSSANRLQNKAETEMMLPYMKQGVRVMLLYHNLYWPECGIINYELAPYSPVLDNAIFCTFMQDSYNFNTDPEKQKFKITSAKFALYNRIMASMMYFDLMAEIKKYDMVFIPRPDEQLWHDLGYLFVGDYKNSKFFFLNSKGKLEPLPTNSKYN